MIEGLLTGEKALAVVGLGYVGLPLCTAFGKVFKKVIGFDIRSSRIEELKKGIDFTGEVPSEDILNPNIEYTDDPEFLRFASFIVVAVPTPVDKHNMPDLRPLISASQTVGRYLSKGSVVVYESTVYPGVTEEICIPVLEEHSGLKCGVDFKVGYSPERINPGDKFHTLENIVKVVAGQDEETTELLAQVYGKVVKAGIYRASSIKVAEAGKVIENIQRDLNIALVNELAIIFHKLGIDTKEVLEVAKTKWNFAPFEPGLVGGHCIGVDPYYLTFKAQEVGYHPEVILAGRRINDYMGKYVAEQTVKELIKSSIQVKGSKILIMGITFKENIRDIRNTKVVDIYKELLDYGVEVYIYDPLADRGEVKREYGIELVDKPEEKVPYDGIVVAVKHRQFRELPPEYFKSLVKEKAVFVDVKGIYKREDFLQLGFRYWRL